MKYKRGYYDVFVRTCGKSPSNIAVRQYDDGVYKAYTYSELFGICEYISQNLQQLNCSKSVIGLITERNIIIPCVIAAAHKCCTTFMFLDPTQDFETVVNDVKFNIIIAIGQPDSIYTQEIFSKGPDKSVSVYGFTLSFYDFNITNNLSSKYSLGHSFISMTSGSTGEPKHIQVPIQCIQPNIDDLTKLFGIKAQDVIYFSTPLTFDPSMIEILLACFNGASLLIAPERPEVLFPRNNVNSVTFWQTTPSKFFQHTDFDIAHRILHGKSTLKVLALGGEPLNGIKRLRELKCPDNKTKIYTLYGVTEMSCWACVTELDLENETKNEKEIPLGHCLSETQLIVQPETSNDNKNIGKIMLVSESRKCVILNKTRKNIEENSLKWIDTGDLGEVKNGSVYYRGRNDDVIKRFGHKVNLQHIEATVMQCPRVKTCSCVWLPKPMQLVLYYSSETFRSQELSDFLKCKLDDKHWPDRIIRVDNLPINHHGKVTKQMLSKLYQVSNPNPLSQNSLKEILVNEITCVLNEKVAYDDIKSKSFFSIGGTSFMAVSMCNRISMTHPAFGKSVLPYLLSDQNSIEKVIELARNKIPECEERKPKRKVKRSRSSNESQEDTVASKKLMPNWHTMGFIVLWSYNTGKCVDASPTLFITETKAYVCVGSHSGKVAVFDPTSGVIHGVVSLKSRVEASVYCFKEPTTKPRGVVGTYDGTIVCFNLDDCRIIWMVNIGSMIKSKAVCCNGFLFVASYDGNVRRIDIENGAIKQVINIAGQPISADLVLAKNEYILLGTLSGMCSSIQTTTNTIVWRGSLTSPVFASPALYDRDKYVVFAEVCGEIHCRTVEKGIKIWSYQGAKGNIFSSMYIKELPNLKWQIVFGCHNSKVYSIVIKKFQPSLHWSCQLASPVYSTPCALQNNFVLAAANKGCLCVIDSERGIKLLEYQLPNETFSSPAVFGEYIFIGCRNDHLYSLKIV